ncbi:MAG: hypothetical protein ABJC74_01130 [Gemmatimonadota bacterium]
MLASLHDTAVVFDFGRSALAAFDRAGQLLWRFGRKGYGPGEFAQVRDVKATPDGDISVLDMGTNRVTIVRPDGSMRRMVTLAESPHADQHLPLQNGRTMTATLEAPGTFAFFDSVGRPERRADFPWDEFPKLEAIERQGLLAREGRSNRWVDLLMVGDGWYSYEGDSVLPFTGRFIEHLDFPSLIVTSSRSPGRVDRKVQVPRASYGAVGVALQDSVVAVLFEGTSKEADRIIDYYAWSSGRYLGSSILPLKVANIAAASGRDLFAVVTQPFPRLMRLHPH